MSNTSTMHLGDLRLDGARLSCMRLGTTPPYYLETRSRHVNKYLKNDLWKLFPNIIFKVPNFVTEFPNFPSEVSNVLPIS